MDRRAWWATVLGVTNSWTQLSDFHFTSLHMENTSHIAWLSGSQFSLILLSTFFVADLMPIN